MDDAAPAQTALQAKGQARLGAKTVLGVLTSLVFCASLFMIAGRLDWFGGWTYVGLLVGGYSLMELYVWRRNPELLRWRARVGEGTKRWDKVCLTLFGLCYVGTPIAAALDVRSCPTPTMPGWLWVPGVLLFAFHLVTVTWAMSTNPHFEKTVRIQHDRGHRVIDTGPYQFVRHPGYMSTVVGHALASPLLLQSWWAFVPAVACAACLVARTALEDRTLRAELPGYEEYAQRTRYRLLPRIW